MSRALHQLLRLKAHQRRESTLVLHRAQAEREAQMAKVVELREAVVRERDAVDAADGGDLAAWSAWRLQTELASRREGVRLVQKSRDADVAGTRHRRDVMDELALGGVIEARAVAEAEEDKRVEGRWMDEIAGRRGAVRNGGSGGRP